jgi:hypothetical protein
MPDGTAFASMASKGRQALHCRKTADHGHTYRHMKHLAIAAVMLWAAIHFGGLLLSVDDRTTEGSLGRLLEAPARSISNPYDNGYFYLFG